METCFNRERTKITEILADFVIKTNFHNLPEDVKHQTRKCFLDFIGVTLAGSTTTPGKIIINFVTEMDADGPSTVIGTSKKASVLNAALANGTMAHTLEIDDGHRYAMGHPGATVIPAVLSVAELSESPGKDFIAAVVLGYEGFIRVATAVNPSHTQRAFHTTGTCGTFAAAIGAGKILDLSKEEMISALGLAGTQASGLWEFVTKGAMSKHLHAGKAAQNGILAALLAKRGFTGPDTILEGEKGFCRAMSDKYDLQKISEGIGKTFGIMNIYFKLHAACRHLHPAIDAAIELAQKHAMPVPEIKRIVVRTYSLAAELNNYDPKTELAAKMSLPYCVAVAVAERQAGLTEFTRDKIRNKKILELAKKVKIVTDSELDKLVPRKRGAMVEITTKNGELYEARRDLPIGEPEVPATEQMLQTKFRNLAKQVLSGSSLEKLKNSIHDLEKLDNVKTLTEILRRNG